MASTEHQKQRNTFGQAIHFKTRALHAPKNTRNSFKTWAINPFQHFNSHDEDVLHSPFALFMQLFLATPVKKSVLLEQETARRTQQATIFFRGARQCAPGPHTGMLSALYRVVTDVLSSFVHLHIKATFACVRLILPP